MIAVVAAFVGARNAAAAPRVERDIAYAFSVRGADARRRQSFDLYLPESPKPAPLVVFIHGGFWAESDDEYGFGKRVADALVADGAAVALVRYRLSPAVKHPTHVRDVAAALAALERLAGRYGYDAKRIYLIGHSAGATIAAQLALDESYLKEVDMRPANLSGVVLLSGIYDLGPAARWRDGSRHLRALHSVHKRRFCVRHHPSLTPAVGHRCWCSAAKTISNVLP